MLFVQQHSIFILIIFSILLHISYQQYALIGDNLKYYSQSHLSSNTIQTFWHDINVDCDLETLELIELYVKLVNQISIENEDQFDVLLRHHVRKRLIHVISQQLVEGFKTKSLKSNEDLMFNLDSIPEKRITKAIWRITINKVYPLIATQDIINEINGLNEKEIQALAYTNLVDKCMWDTKITEILMPILAYHISLLFKQHISCDSLQKNKDHVYCRLPAELRLLYDNSKRNIYLLNILNVDYYLSKVILDKIHRLNITSHDNGLISFSLVDLYLYADENQKVIFADTPNVTTNQLWQVLWPEYAYSWQTSDFLIFKNIATKNLLCEIENNFQQLKAAENMLNFACYWWVKTNF